MPRGFPFPAQGALLDGVSIGPTHAVVALIGQCRGVGLLGGSWIVGRCLDTSTPQPPVVFALASYPLTSHWKPPVVGLCSYRGILFSLLVKIREETLFGS